LKDKIDLQNYLSGFEVEIAKLKKILSLKKEEDERKKQEK
jgi:hypothetical protein